MESDIDIHSQFGAREEEALEATRITSTESDYGPPKLSNNSKGSYFISQCKISFGLSDLGSVFQSDNDILTCKFCNKFHSQV